MRFCSFQVPNKVENLTVSAVTETFLSLVWDKPPGNVDFYLVEVDGRQNRSISEGAQFGDLTPGHSYTFRVLSGVQDEVTWSEESTITAFTSGLTSHTSKRSTGVPDFYI